MIGENGGEPRKSRDVSEHDIKDVDERFGLGKRVGTKRHGGIAVDAFFDVGHVAHVIVGMPVDPCVHAVLGSGQIRHNRRQQPRANQEHHGDKGRENRTEHFAFHNSGESLVVV